MTRQNRKEDFFRLRKQHPVFFYHDFHVDRQDNSILFSWTFEISPGITFNPSLRVPTPYPNTYPPPDVLENIAFHIGMIELISYWKAACPPRIVIRKGSLSEEALGFWKKIYFLGLGEFRYLNGIDISQEEFLSIESEGPERRLQAFNLPKDRVLLPIGGGKDSVVSLSLLKDAGKQIIPFMVNPLAASIRCIQAAGIDKNAALVFKRTLDPKLLELNSIGYLNGHTPFSAVLAFNSLLGAILSGAGSIALSNENSANEASVPGTDINHQYSKSFDFEIDFREYVKGEMHTDINYFSFLRPLSELQIGALFAERKEFHPAFLSCNVGSKTDQWCGKCPKCLFTAIILLPFLDINEIHTFMGTAIFNKPELEPILKELAGWKEVKPFECVGTISEVRLALRKGIDRHRQSSLPPLLAIANQKLDLAKDNTQLFFNEALHQVHEPHFVPEDLHQILIKSLEKL